MDKNNKTNSILIVLISSFFYYIVFFEGLNLIFKGENRSLPDSILMLSLYATFATTFIFAFKAEFFKQIFNIKQVKYAVIVMPIFMILLGFILTLTNDYAKSNKDPQSEILNRGNEVYKNASISVDMSDINKSLIYKKDGNKLLKKDNGIVRQFKPLYSEDMASCAYSLYTVNDGYILACDYNKNINYFSFTGDSNEPYYQFNLNEKYLNKLESQNLVKLDISDESTYHLYEIDNGKYYSEQAYNQFTLYRQFNNEYYLPIKSWDIKKEIEKKYKIRYIEVSRFYIKFLANNFEYYLAKCEIDDEYNIKIEYIKQ